MAQFRISLLEGAKIDTSAIEEQLAGLDYELVSSICKSDGEKIQAIKGVDVIINRAVPMSRSVIQEIDKATAIISTGHGFDRIDHDAATDHGIMLVNTAGFCTEEVSNHVIMLLLACAKNLAALDDAMKSDGWSSAGRSQAETGPPVHGETLGLISLGNISRATSRKAQVFGLDVIAFDPYVEPWIAREYTVRLMPSLEELARQSDYVSMHAPFSPSTRHMIGKSFFDAMKPTAYFINTSRGGTVDERALIGALQTGQIAGAGIDVFEREPNPADNPLMKMSNVVLTPHTAGLSRGGEAIRMVQVGQETARILRGTFPMSLVNPDVRTKIAARPPATNA